MTKRVLITGGSGYVGSVLTPILLGRGHSVSVLDIGWFGWPKDLLVTGNLQYQRHRMDIRDRNAVKSCLREFRPSTVLHLACVSNDASYDLDPELGEAINYTAFEPLVKECQHAGVAQFIYASSSSVYGIRPEPATEETPPNPLTDYSKWKAVCEEVLHDYAEKFRHSVIVRPATLCGWSPRMRTDLMVNSLTCQAFQNNEIRVFGSGDQYRSHLHLLDMCSFYVDLIETEPLQANGMAFNVVDPGANMTVLQLASTIQEFVEQFGVRASIKLVESDDKRSYQVDGSRAESLLGFRTMHDLGSAIAEVGYWAGKTSGDLFSSDYVNVKRMQEVLACKFPM